MASTIGDRDLLYQLHHSLDPVILPVANRILKMNCFKIAKKHFEWDLLNDIGIINLLRRDYLHHGSFHKTFKLYQESRLDNRSHRYETLFALLIVTIVGNVVAGLILDNLKENKMRIKKWLQYQKEKEYLFGIRDTSINIFEVVYNKRRLVRHIDKFCSSNSNKLLTDFQIIRNCYVARRMQESELISYEEYIKLVTKFLNKQRLDLMEPLTQKFRNYLTIYNSEKDHIDIDKVLLAINAYGKGTIAQKMDSVGGKLNLPQNTDTANFYHGLPASPGAVAGISHVFGSNRIRTIKPIILVADSTKFSPEDIHFLTSSAGAVTTNTGMTGHIPVICRGIGIGCVVLHFDDFSQIQNGDKIVLCGKTGIVATGVMVEMDQQ